MNKWPRGRFYIYFSKRFVVSIITLLILCFPHKTPLCMSSNIHLALVPMLEVPEQWKKKKKKNNLARYQVPKLPANSNSDPLWAFPETLRGKTNPLQTKKSCEHGTMMHTIEICHHCKGNEKGTRWSIALVQN